MTDITQPVGIRRVSTVTRIVPAWTAFIAPILLLAVVAIIFLSLLVFEVSYAGRIYPGIQMWDIDLGGLRPEEAAQALEVRLPYTNQAVITLRDGDRSWTVRPVELGIEFDADAVAQTAYQLGRTGSALDNWQTQAKLLWSGAQVGPVVRVDPLAARAYLEALSTPLLAAPRDASLRLEGVSVVATSSVVGRRFKVEAVLPPLIEAARTLAPADIPLVFETLPPAVADVTQAKVQLEAIVSAPITVMAEPSLPGPVGPWTLSRNDLASMTAIRREGSRIQVSLDEARLRNFVAPIAPKIERPAVDARFVFDDKLKEIQVISPSVPGRALNIPATAARISQQALTGQRQVSLVVTTTQATYHDQLTARELGVTELVGQGVTYFAGSSKERVKNIATAAARFHGIVIAPGETFSFNKYLGDVSLEQGFAEALIIYQGRTIKGVGGGVCQVSTTVFRGAYLAGYPIVTRWPHAYRVSWYEKGFGPGLDATVFAPEVDFRFTNDTPYHLLMETYTSPTYGTLTWKFYSTKDGRTVKVAGPLVTNVAPHGPDKYEEDSAFKPGQKEQVDWAVDGADVTVRRTVERNVQVVTDTVFTRYQPWQSVFKVAPGEAPPTPTPTPGPLP